ncbi:MAG: EamA family transporter [Egibacteraceae bacterium]
MGELLAFSALTMFSLNALVVGEASRRVDYDWGFFIALLVNTAVAFAIVTVQLVVVGRAPVLEPLPLLFFLLAGVFATYLGRLLFFSTVVGMGPSRASAFQITQPVFASVLALVFLGQRLRPVEVALMGVILGGLFVVNRSRMAVTPEGEPPSPHAAKSVRGVGGVATVERVRALAVRQRLLLVALGSGLSYAMANVFRSGAINRWNEPVIGSLLGALAGLGCYLALHVRAREVPARLRATERRGLRLFVASGVLTILAQTATIASLRFLPVAIANVFSVSLPILVIPLSLLLLRNREGITPQTVGGVVITWAGVVGLVLA